MKKICFVIMGFGKKKDSTTNRTINLDATYMEIIKPSIEDSGYKCVRADEILESGMIDKSMYLLLYAADLVVADISTANPNALYELGIRHVCKPNATIVIQESDGVFPFDVGHIRTISYQFLGNTISDHEVMVAREKLKETIFSIEGQRGIDSPFYEFMQCYRMHPPFAWTLGIRKKCRTLQTSENSIYQKTKNAMTYMSTSKFDKAQKIWEKLAEEVNNVAYYKQQAALCCYKNKELQPEIRAIRALKILDDLQTSTQDDETLGMIGACHKILWKANNEQGELRQALAFYEKAWGIWRSYYSGENVANCYIMLAFANKEDKTVYADYLGSARAKYHEVATIAIKELEKEPEDAKWKYATLANCYYGVENWTDGEKYEKLFLRSNAEQWEVETFNDTKQFIYKIYGKNL